jgi:outer membrane protein assembly factor BamE (lipoprotein component of BamABCDE complex)
MKACRMQIFAPIRGHPGRVAKFALRPVAAMLCVLGALGCTPQLAKRGQVIDPDAASKLTAGVSTRAEVQRVLGSPTVIGTFDKDVWYYIGQDMEKVAFFKPETTDRKILAVKFDPKGTVKQVSQLDLSDGKQVELVTRETPTAGNETTLFQDLFGNIGRFAGASSRGPGATPGGR